MDDKDFILVAVGQCIEKCHGLLDSINIPDKSAKFAPIGSTQISDEAGTILATTLRIQLDPTTDLRIQLDHCCSFKLPVRAEELFNRLATYIELQTNPQ